MTPLKSNELSQLVARIAKGAAGVTLAGFVLTHCNQDIDLCKDINGTTTIRSTMSLANEPLWDGPDVQQNRVDYGVYTHYCRDGRTVAVRVEKYRRNEQGKDTLHSISFYDQYGKKFSFPDTSFLKR